jgi:hypothetical protein
VKSCGYAQIRNACFWHRIYDIGLHLDGHDEKPEHKSNQRHCIPRQNAKLPNHRKGSGKYHDEEIEIYKWALQGPTDTKEPCNCIVLYVHNESDCLCSIKSSVVTRELTIKRV